MSDRPTELTREQKAAIETRGVSIGLSAGAGCGKTFVLTERFLTHLAPHASGDRHGRDPFSQVVAITFTDRAAREMRDRIHKACRQRLDDCPPDEVEHWLSILHRIDGARISTIHSFCAAFLRRHAVAAAVDPRFKLLEEETGDALVRLSIERTVRRLLEQGDSNCLKLVVHYGLEGARRAIEKLLSGHVLLDAGAFSGRTADEFQSAWTEHLQNRFIPQLLRDLAASPLVAEILGLLNEHDSSNAVMRQRRTLLIGRLAALGTADPTATVPLLQEIRDAAQVQRGGGKKAWPSEEAYEAVKTVFAKLREEIGKVLTLAVVNAEDITRDAELTAAAVNVVDAVASDFAAAKSEAGLLDFDDLLVRTRDLLRSSEAARNEASESIAALLVDEFQDTDRIQSEIVRTLVGGTLKTGKLFVVGDAKQSIYRFRQADPTVFDDLRRAIPEAGRLPLTRNFRSQPEILNFVNAVFAAALNVTYEPLVPHLKQVSPTPCIEFLFAAPNSDDEESDRAEDRRRQEANWMARRIQQLLSDPTPRIPEKDPDTGKRVLRPPRAGDIAILFRALSDVAIYEDAFRRMGIDYYLVGGRAFFAQQEVYDLVNLCSFLNDPDDAIGLVGILRSPFFSVADDTLFSLAGGDRPLWQVLGAPLPSFLPESQQEQIRSASRVLGDLLHAKDRIPLAELLQRAIEMTGYDASLLHEFLGRRKVANLRKLIDMARQFDRSGLATLTDFVQRLRDSIREETIEELAATHPEASNVVKLMTVHQSKGLEFPIVIIADMDRHSLSGSLEATYHREFGPLLPPPAFGDEKRLHVAMRMARHIESSEDEEESLRVLYVAMTRAADYLILSSGLPANRRLRSSWLKLLAERFDLSTGLPAGDPYLGTKLKTGKKSLDAIPDIFVHRKPPEIAVVRRSQQRQAPLTRFREIVEAGEAAPLPSLMQPVLATSSVRPQLSVSAIEQADAYLRGSTSRRPAFVDLTEESDPSANEDDATLVGTVVHGVIERLEGRSAEQIDALVNAAVRGLSPLDSQRISAESVRRRVQSFIDSDLPVELSQSGRCFREIDFLLTWPVDATVGNERATISGKLDCLLQTQDGAWKILDYKTGRVPESDPAALAEHFSIQLVLYARAVEAMIGRLPDSIEIVALHDELRRFPLTLWKEFVEPVASRIDAAVKLLTEASR